MIKNFVATFTYLGYEYYGNRFKRHSINVERFIYKVFIYIIQLYWFGTKGSH